MDDYAFYVVARQYDGGVQYSVVKDATKEQLLCATYYWDFPSQEAAESFISHLLYYETP